MGDTLTLAYIAVIMLVGIFGGVSLFGPMGFIIGPLVLSILLTLIENIPKIDM